jgi:hypothetical protein
MLVFELQALVNPLKETCSTYHVVQENLKKKIIL